MDFIQQKIKDLNSQISALDENIRCARKEQVWDLVNQLIDEVQELEKEYDELKSFVARQESLQEIEDFWDDEKNRDSYTLMIIEKEFSEVIND
jgi:predicted nuclease with TOPRIM domain